tara:strand:+ start:1764 stop:2210 length:447 start_codon:yes stop_codon:yes gene_type:complete
MKRTELKKILKPLIKECVREAILDEGILSGIISEVARGVGAPDSKQPSAAQSLDLTAERMKRNAFDGEQTKKLQEHKSKLMEAIGKSAYNGVNLFEGTSPAPAQGSLTEVASPLASQGAADPGVDISNLFGSVGRNWTAHMSNVKDGK